jgi:membrane protein
MKSNKINKFKEFIPVYIVIETYKSWRADRTLRLGAGLAYYGVFAIIPILTLMVGVAAYFFSTQDIVLYVQEALTKIFGTDLSTALGQAISRITTESAQNTLSLSSIISLCVLFVTASFIFVAFQDALDTIWHNPIRLGWKKWIKRYLGAYIVVLIISLVLFSVLLINTMGKIAQSFLPGQFVALENLANLVVSLSSWALGIIVLTVIYRLMIFQKISWVILVISSTITSILIVVGTWVLGLYLSNYADSSISGAVGAVLLLLIWIYYEAQIILVGAQLIKILDQNIKKLPKILFSKSK